MNGVIFARRFAAIKIFSLNFEVEKGAAIKFFSLNFQVENGAVWLRLQLAATGPYDKGWSFSLFSMVVYCIGSADSHLSEMLFYSPLHWACASCCPRKSDELDRLRWHLPLFG